MPLPVSDPDTALVRFKLVYGAVPRSSQPTSASALILTRQPDPSGFYSRDTLAGPLVFTGEDFELLYAIERSTARCAPLRVLVEHRGAVGLPWETWRGRFTCNKATWNLALCTATVTPEPDDFYTDFLNAYETEWNLLVDAPATSKYRPPARVTVEAQLAALALGVEIQFLRMDSTDPDYPTTLGSDGWTLFYTNNSQIHKPILGSFQPNHDILLFRYIQRGVALLAVQNTDPVQYIPADRSGSGWKIPTLVDTQNSAVTPPTVDYVKEPSIAGFKPYKLTGYGDNTPFYRTEGDGHGKGIYVYGSTVKVSGSFDGGLFSGYKDLGYALGQEGVAPQYGGYLGQFLSLNIGKQPSDYGYNAKEWVSIYDTAGALNARVDVDSDNQRALFWKFGVFGFGRCFPLRDGLYSLLWQTITGSGIKSLAALLPPTSNDLGDFLTADVNPATGERGAANEVPRLLLSAGSDVKRFGDSEAATRLLVSLKQFLSDLAALYDGGWFIDPATGWLRFEHRSYLEAQRAAGVEFDLRTLEDVILTQTYSYRNALLPRYETLEIASASTEDLTNGLWFGKSSIDYGLSGCVNQKAGENRTTSSSSRLTGDVAAMVLNGDSIPDSAIALLAPDPYFKLPNANREVSATQLQVRYWRRGRAAWSATVEGPAPPLPPNTPAGMLPVTGPALAVQSVRPPLEQADVSGRLCSLASLAAPTSYITNLSAGGQLAKAELNLYSRQVKLTAWLPELSELTAPPAGRGRQFDDSFAASFD